VLMSHFWEDFLSGFFSVSMIMIPVTCWGSWPSPLESQRMVTWNDVSFNCWLTKLDDLRCCSCCRGSGSQREWPAGHPGQPQTRRG
jgi:hypothetical protein